MEQDIYGDSFKTQAIVLTALALAVVKVNVNAFSFFSTFKPEDDEKATELGLKLLKGEIDPEKYVKEFEKIAINAIDKDKRDGVEFDAYTKEQIKMRVASSHGQASRIKNKLREERKLVAKQLTGHGYLKKYQNSDGSYSYYRSNIKIEKSEYDKIKADHSSKDTLTEAEDFEPRILSFLQANPHSSYNAILNSLGVDPKSGKAIPVYHAVKKALETGKVQREKIGKGFAYSISGTAPAPQPAAPAGQPAVAKVSKYSIRDPQRVLQIWGSTKEEALNHIEHELEYTESLLDLAPPQGEQQKRILQRIADLQSQKNIIKDGAKSTSAVPDPKTKSAPSSGGVSISGVLKKITKFRDKLKEIEKTQKYHLELVNGGTLFTRANTIDPKALSKLIKDNPETASVYMFRFYGLDPQRPGSNKTYLVKAYFAGSKAGKLFIAPDGTFNQPETEITSNADLKPFIIKKNAKDVKAEALLQQIANDFKYFNPGGWMKSDVEIGKSYVQRDFRGVGDWQSRRGEEDDDSPIWRSQKQAERAFNDWAKTKSWKRFVNLDVWPQEKEWASYRIQLKKK